MTWWSRLLFAAAALLLNWKLNAAAIGTADPEGISYRQYAWKERVSWDEVREIRWEMRSIKIKLRRARGCTGELHFQVHARNIIEAFQYGVGRKVPPEFTTVERWFASSQGAIVSRG